MAKMTEERRADILHAEGLADWRIVEFPEAYCWPDLKQIDFPADGDLGLFLHEIAHALAPLPGHTSEWAAIYTSLFCKYLCAAEARCKAYRSALQSIAANTCCDRCQEAALVAKAALTPPPAAEEGKVKFTLSDKAKADIAAINAQVLK
jgi:hypothetical protein